MNEVIKREFYQNTKIIRNNLLSLISDNNRINDECKTILDNKYLKLHKALNCGLILRANKKMRQLYLKDKELVYSKIINSLCKLYKANFNDNNEFTDDEIENCISIISDISISNMDNKNFTIIITIM